MDYYYLAASLPSLALGAPPPLSLDAFRARCAEHLAHRDREALEGLLGGAGGGEGHPFVREWRALETALRHAVAAVRAARLRRPPPPLPAAGVPGADADTARTVGEAFQKATPLDRELALDRFRWRRLEELAGFNPFAARAVLAYGLQLALAWRWHALDAAAGTEVIRNLVARQPAGEQRV
jgi:hypothetical protein